MVAMATADNVHGPKEDRVLVRTFFRRDASPEELLRKAREWSGGFRPDTSYPPVRIRPPRKERATYESKGLAFWVVRGFVDPTRVAELEASPGDLKVLKVTRDSPLDPMAVECGAGEAVGTVTRAVIALRVKPIWKKGYKGRGIVVGVVDGGITATGRVIKPGEVARIDGVVGGWPEDWGTTALGWGPTNEQHGNMVAFNVLAMAPQAQLWDIRIWEDAGGTPAERFAVYVSNALAGYQAAITGFQTNGVPQILTNSWGLYDRNNGIEYATDDDSDFALIVEEALDAGMLLLFAAGNCGTGCLHPSTTPCGAADKGPDNSILGPNGHPDVMTVGAATVHADWYGYTSQGRAVLPPHAAKPDFCSMTKFDGFFPTYGPKPYDGGTSAACATAAGVVGLLKQYRPNLTQAEAKTALAQTAWDIRAAGADMDSGAGIIQASAAFNVI
jgi:serine protease AprX